MDAVDADRDQTEGSTKNNLAYGDPRTNFSNPGMDIRLTQISNNPSIVSVGTIDGRNHFHGRGNWRVADFCRL
jgi:hypothetical protein